MGQIRRDLPNDEYQAAIGANNPSASNVFATIADLASAGIPTGIGVGTDAYASTIPGVTSYNDGDTYIIKFTNGNTADSTIDINGLGVKTLTKQVGVQVTGGDILDGQEIIIIYDGTNFQCIGLSTNQLFAFVTNAEAITITKGQPVYAFSGTGNRMSVKLASNTSDATSAQTVGLVYSSSIAANQTGFIIIQGVISGVNTGAYTAGNQLYLGATAGTLTNVKPYAPNHLVYLGIVERANAGNGLIYVRTQNGYELDELHDVDLITTPPTDGDVLTYDGVSGLWVNQSPASTVTPQVVLFADLGTTEPLKPCTYFNGPANDGVGATLTANANGPLSTVSFTDRIDNTVPLLGQTILVFNEVRSSNPTLNKQFQNGVYTVTSLGSSTTPWILTRSVEADTSAELYPLQVNIQGGQTLVNRALLQKTVDPIVGNNTAPSFLGNIVFTGTTIGVSDLTLIHVDTVATSALPSCTYTSGTNPLLPGLNATLTANAVGPITTINGLTLAVGNRILVTGQANASHNGDYTVTAVGSNPNPPSNPTGAPWRLTRFNAWGSTFTRLAKEWKVNNPGSTKFGSRYSTNLASLSNTNVGVSPAGDMTFFEVPSLSSSGRFGIADSNGVYTYYTTLSLAMTAATAGQTIEMFADVTETGAVTITLKNGVNINGNGHTYTLTTNSQQAFALSNSISTTANILNLNVTCTGTLSSCLFLATNTSGTLTFTGSVFRNTSNGTCISNLSNSDIEVIDFKGYSNSGTCISWASSGGGRLRNSYCNSTSSYGYIGNIRVDNCICISGTLIGLYNQGNVVSESIGISSGGAGIQTISGVLNNCKGYSSAGPGIYVLYANAYSCFGYSTASYGIQFDNEPCRGYNCFGFSTVNNGIRMYRFGSGADLQIFNSTALSTSAIAFFYEGYATTMTCISEYNNAAGHAVQGTNNSIISNSSLSVINTSANCLYSPSAITQKYAKCTFKGSTTPVNANITQGVVNTEDNQGNILI